MMGAKNGYHAQRKHQRLMYITCILLSSTWAFFSLVLSENAFLTNRIIEESSLTMVGYNL